MNAAPSTLMIIHNAMPADVEAYDLSPGLVGLMHSPTVRRKVLRGLAAEPAARLTLAVANGAIVGHVAVASSFGRWLTLPRVREIAFEVAREWRRLGVLTRLLNVAMADPGVEDEILLAFLMPSAWDTGYERLGPLGYRERLTTIGAKHGFRPIATDEPEIGYEGGLLARIGGCVPRGAVAAFEQARYLGHTERRAAA